MKIFWVILSCICFQGILSAQISAELEKDTLQANLYLQQAEQLKKGQPDRLNLIKQANDIYQNYPFLPQAIAVKSLYAHELYSAEEKNLGTQAQELAQEAIQQALLYLQNDLHVTTVKAHLTLMAYNIDYDHDSISVEKRGKAIEPIVEKGTLGQFELLYWLSTHYAYYFFSEEHEEVVAKMTTNFEQIPQPDIQIRVWYYQVMIKHNLYLNQNYQKALSYAEELEQLLNLQDVKTRIPLAHDKIIAYLLLQQKTKVRAEIQKLTAYMSEVNFSNKIKIAELLIFTGDAHLYTHQGYDGYQKEYRKCVNYYEKALEILLSNSLKNRETISYIYSQLGWYYFQQGEYEKSLTYRINALDYSQNIDNYGNVALSLLQAGRIDDALEYIQKSLSHSSLGFELSGIEDNPDLSSVPLNNDYLSETFLLKCYGIYAKSKTDQTAAEKIYWLELLLKTSEFLTEYQEKGMELLEDYEASFLSYNQGTIFAYGWIRLALYELNELKPSEKLMDKMFYYTEKRKAMSLMNTLTPSPLPQEVISIKNQLKKDLNQLELKTSLAEADSSAFYQRLFLEKSKELDTYQQKIKEQYPKTVANINFIEYATMDDIAANLDDNTLFISVDAQDFDELDEYATVTLTAISNTERKIIRKQAQKIFQSIKALEKLNKNPLLIQKKNKKDFIDNSHQLYQIIIEPLKEMLERKSNLIIVQEGQFLQVPFEILLSSKTNKPFHEMDFLIKNYNISYHYSGTVYLEFKKRETVRDNSLLAFAPVFDQLEDELVYTGYRKFLVDSLHRGVNDGRFIPLPNSKTEVESISEKMGKVGTTKTLLEKQATKEKLLAELKEKPYQFVHIATHGLVNMENYQLSGLACANEANQTNEMDAMLIANEIQQLDINADLVVLSSCESGVGMVIRGEGLIAINRAFFYAGAKNVLFSLWKVNDQYTADLMIDFYDNYLKTNNYAQALRQAKLKMLNNPITANPRYWAPFVLIGE